MEPYELTSWHEQSRNIVVAFFLPEIKKKIKIQLVFLNITSNNTL
jgi:hypothetical protein